jgi:serine/threonine protein kinase
MSNLLYDGQRLLLTGVGLVNEEKLKLDERFANHDLYFWSPEAITRDKLDHKSDLYSAGMLLYFLLVGDFPFKGSNPCY